MPTNILILKLTLAEKTTHLHWIDMAHLDIIVSLFHIMLSCLTAVTGKANSIFFFTSKDLMKNLESNSLFKIRLVSITIKYKNNKISEEKR